MTWNSILKKYRTGRGMAGIYKRACRRWIQGFFRQNWGKRKIYFEKFVNKELSQEEFEELLKKTEGNIPEEEIEINDYKKKFISNTLSEDEMNFILKNAIPDMFFINDMITGIGGNPELKLDYNRAMQFIMKERKLTEIILRVFWKAPEYEHLVNNGHTENEIWQKFMNASVSRGVFPLFCDPYDGRYKLLDMYDYIYILQRRTKSIASEVLTKAEDFKSISGMFPSVKDLLPATDGEVERLKSFETLKLNPPQFICPFCHETFDNEELLKQHIANELKEQST